MEPECSLPHSQELSTCPYPEPDHPTSTRSILIISTHLRLGLPSGLLPSGFPPNNLYVFLLSRIRATWPANLILLNLKSRRSSLCSFLNPPVTYIIYYKFKTWICLLMIHVLPQFMIRTTAMFAILAIPVTGREKSRLSHFLQSAHRWRWGCKRYEPGVRPFPQEDSLHSFLLKAESIPGPSAAGRIR
jgi:hypothetical protein